MKKLIKDKNVIGIISAACLLICRFMISAASLMQNAFASGASAYNTSEKAVDMTKFTEWYFEYYNFVWIVDLIAVVFSVLIFLQLIVNVVNHRNEILKYIICIAWLVSTVFNSVYIRDNIFPDIMRYETAAQIGTIALLVFIVLISLDMLLHSKPGRIAGTICIIIYAAFQILGSVLSLISNLVILSTLAISIPVFIMIVYFVVPAKTQKSLETNNSETIPKPQEKLNHSDLKKSFCPNCGKQVSSTAGFCTYCGYKIK